MKRLLNALLSISLVLAFTATLAPVANAVIKNVTVTGPGGDPIGKQTVLINFPPGVTDADGKTSAEAETDDDGGLIFDFPGDGEYRIDHDEGSMTIVVKGGIPTWVKVGGGLLAIGGIWYAVDANGGGNGNNNGNGGNGGNGGTNGGNGGTNGGNGGTNGGNGGTNGGNGGTNGGNGGTNGGSVDGEYNTVTFSVTSNPAMHPDGPFQSARYTVTKDLDTGDIQILVQGNGAEATLQGTCDEDGNFTASGPGFYSCCNTTFSMSGTFTIMNGTVNFTISGGDDGGLPMGEPIVGDGTAQR